MKRFAALYQELDRSTATLDKRAALIAYFEQAPEQDAVWALYLLSGGKISHARQKIASSTEMRAWVADVSGVAPWLVEECYEQVGDLAETLALLVPGDKTSEEDRSLAEWIETVLIPIANREVSERGEVIMAAWRTLSFDERLVFNKLLTGALRVGVSQRTVQQALAEMSQVPISLIAQRMLGAWVPSVSFFRDLLSQSALPGDSQQPYPFYLASPLEVSASELGPIGDWLIEWKWDGIRVQLIRRPDGVALWSRGEERLDGRFPELEAAAAAMSRHCVLDGELLAWQGQEPMPLPFSALQTRIQRLKPGPKWLKEAPVRLLVYDLLELEGEDLRDRPQAERRQKLEALLHENADSRLMASPLLDAVDWEQAAALREQSRELGVEGLMLKRRDAPYRSGRRRGDWWKWKVDPLSIDAVLLYAQAGHGRRSSLYTDYTFGLWDGDVLVPIAKAYSGLDDKEILQLDRWLRAHTRERFGPVRSVDPVQVFELGFEGVNISKRHKSGIAVRFPRILRWRHDKPAEQADQLSTLQALAR